MNLDVVHLEEHVTEVSLIKIETLELFIAYDGEAGIQCVKLRDLDIDAVIPPILRGLWRRTYAAICVSICRFSFWTGVMPPMPMLGRSLL